ncbi:MAG TPA: GDP-mannose 4,6-dehydratase [Myxococcota bacterium]|nr:GDP-mannose 4,6-dehydratase [Myxococcota bacterium]
MQALVTGAAGFVGRHLVPRMQREGWQVRAVDRELDVRDADAVAGCVAELAPRAIVHLAAQSSVAQSSDAPEASARINYLGACNLLEAVSRHAPRARVLLVGSGEQYGPAEPGGAPWNEAAPLRPRSPYARSKACADLLGAGYAARGSDVVRVRAFNHTGPGQSDVFVLASFARQAALIAAGRREPEIAVGNLDSVRDFLDVDDVVDAYLRLLDPRVPAGAYNVASGVGRRIGALLDALRAEAGIEARVRVDPARVRPADASVGDAAKLRAATGWAPRVPFELTLRRLLDDWCARVAAA